MVFYTPHHTARLEYITAFIGKELLGEKFQLITDAAAFRQSTGPKINYSDNKLTGDEYWIVPHTLLFEQGVRQQEIVVFEENGVKAFFNTGGDLSFDIFAAAFYLLSRYEEYLPHEKDEYGRYAYENSLAWKKNFLRTPLVNQWIQILRSELQKKYPAISLSQTAFRFLPTYDIDEAYSYRHKNALRSVGAMIKALLKGDWSRISQRRRVLSGKEPDPFDSYAWMDELHEKYKLKPYYFFLVPVKTGKYDRNILPQEKAVQDLIRHHSSKYTIGVHPSWQSGDAPRLVKEEINTIENITNKKITSSRQHFIRLTLPQTFRYLLDAGIKEDFSMGYGSINGFRASVASPFYWYDLEKETVTGLLLYPFCYMEANSFFEQKYTSEQGLEEMQHYYREVKAVNGLLITLWHNTFLGTDKLFEGWRSSYLRFIEQVTAIV
jgi:hypothetical protein